MCLICQDSFEKNNEIRLEKDNDTFSFKDFLFTMTLQKK